MSSPVIQTKDPTVLQKLERFSNTWRRYSSMVRIVSSTLLRQPSQLADAQQHTVWLLDNTAYRQPASHISGEPHSWRVEVVACVFRKDSRRDVSKFVAVIADLVGLDGELGTEKEIRHRIARRLQPFLYHVVPDHSMMLELPLPNHTAQIHQIGPTGDDGISSQMINTGVRHIADGARVRSHIRGLDKASMETTFAGPEGWLVVSDIDDTIKYTKTSDTTGILRTTFAEEPKPIAGMPQLYARIDRRFEPTWFYLSASPYNLYPFLRGFLRDHFSPGTLVLRDSSWLDISELVKSFTVNTLEYKVDRIRKIRRWFPRRRALCIGDSTQTDPEAYAEIYRRHPEWIHAILIRKVMDVPHMEEQNSPKRFAEAFKDVPKHMKPAKRYSTTMDEQTFVPDTMRALYWCPASTAIRDGTSLDNPRVDSETVFDTDFPTPKPSPAQYLIKVQAAAFSHDELRLAKELNPSKSIPQVPVHNVCGTVISTPSQDHDKPDGPKFKVDETVFGLIDYSQDGAAADYVLGTDDELAHKPQNISATEAATIPLPALTAWQALFKYAGLDPTKGKDLRVLITNAHRSEVGTQALHLLRSKSLFPNYNPWICATCASEDAANKIRQTFQIDEIIQIPEPVPKGFDLTAIFRRNKWAPVDVVLDCTCEDILHQSNNPAIIKDGGAILSAVDANPVLNFDPRKSDGEPQSRFVYVEPDGKTLGMIANMVENGTLRGRVGTVIDLVNGAACLSPNAMAAGGERGGIHVLRVN
ncbi:uncharacterized protein BDV17DRAFT_280624 [Aspergillus undulatus]|uniref:uncharacterized protein n=1 Tax=Aspergillus undulatus TaxID=1810928 RepID=UPI003CCCC78A